MDKKLHTAEAQMLINKNVDEVFNAFIDPDITSNFWFTKGSDKLVTNSEITWTWEMFNFSAKVVARKIIPNQLILFDWFAYDKPTQVSIGFKSLRPDATFVTVVHSGFDKTGDELIDVLKDSTGGFSLVLAGLKSYLEHGINLNLVADKFPKELTQHEEELRARKNN